MSVLSDAGFTSWPRSISAQRIGWGETEYGDDGESAPLRWTCTCGVVQFDVERFLTHAQKVAFVREHANCPSGQ